MARGLGLSASYPPKGGCSSHTILLFQTSSPLVQNLSWRYLTAMKKLPRGINPNSQPTGNGCEECLTTDGWWLHLRRCAECGYIGCCDTSPGQHAAKHAAETGHPIVASFEPLQGWFYDYATGRVFRAVRLLSPRSRPEHQSAPGPEGKVPENWESLLHDVA
jgi:Zn-finger in ubiquitin-hydrolases and other protein